MQLRINSYLRAVAPQGRESERVGPFTATCTPENDNRYLNYAIPDDDATPSLVDVHALIAWFEARRRTPRLEYVAEEAPAVEPVLIAEGFTVEGRLKLMVWDVHSPTSPPPHGIELLVPSGDAELYGLMAATAEAYGSPPPSRDDIESTSKRLEHGSGAVIARATDDGTVVGGGTFPPIVHGVTEVAGIGVVLSHRRRGIAQALACRLAEEAVARGAETPFLMAADDTAASIYERAGYRTVGEVLHISR